MSIQAPMSAGVCHTNPLTWHFDLLHAGEVTSLSRLCENEGVACDSIGRELSPIEGESVRMQLHAQFIFV